MNELRKIIENSAALLDRKKPGWHRQINIDMLSMRSLNYCIIGQLYFGDFSKAMEELSEIKTLDDKRNYQSAWIHNNGFCDCEPAYKDYWIEEIKSRND